MDFASISFKIMNSNLLESVYSRIVGFNFESFFNFHFVRSKLAGFMFMHSMNFKSFNFISFKFEHFKNFNFTESKLNCFEDYFAMVVFINSKHFSYCLRL